MRLCVCPIRSPQKHVTIQRTANTVTNSYTHAAPAYRSLTGVVYDAPPYRENKNGNEDKRKST